MGLKGVLSGLGMNPLGMCSLLLSLGAFLAILLWTFTRSPAEIEVQSRLWEDEDDHG